MAYNSRNKKDGRKSKRASKSAISSKIKAIKSIRGTGTKKTMPKAKKTVSGKRSTGITKDASGKKVRIGGGKTTTKMKKVVEGVRAIQSPRIGKPSGSRKTGEYSPLKDFRKKYGRKAVKAAKSKGLVTRKPTTTTKGYTSKLQSKKYKRK